MIDSDEAVTPVLPAGRRDAILGRVSLLIGLAILSSTIGLVIAASGPLPFADQWDNLISDHALTWMWLTEQHNEHRILFPRLVFLIDHLLTRDSNLVNLAVNVGLQAITLGLMLRLAGGLGLGGETHRAWVFGVLLAFLFSAMQDENFTWGFQVQFFGICTLCIATLMVAALAPPGVSSTAAVVALEAVALYTLSSGAVLVILTIVLAVWLRRPRRDVALLILAAGLLLGSYLHGYATPPEHADPLDAVINLDRIALYVLTALGNPIWALVPLRSTAPAGSILAPAFGAIGLAMFGGWGWRLARRRDTANGSETVLFGLATFGLAMAVLAALGRWRFGTQQALAGRYTTPMLLFWLALLLERAAAGRRRTALRPDRALLAGLAILGLMLFGQPRYIVRAMRNNAARQAAAVAVLAGVNDAEVLRQIYSQPEAIAVHRDALKADHASVFAAAWADWLDQPFPDQTGWPVGACPGGFGQVRAVPDPDHPGWRANGLLRRDTIAKLSDRIIFVDQEGRVAGYGVSGLSARSAVLPDDLPGADWWLGEIRQTEPATVKAYALRTDGLPACSLGSPQTVLR